MGFGRFFISVLNEIVLKHYVFGVWGGHPETRSNLLSSILPPNVTTPSWISLTVDMMKNDER